MPTSLEDVRVLKSAEQIADAIYKVASRWDDFAKDVVGKQISRAADSVGADIAKSFGRYHFLKIFPTSSLTKRTSHGLNPNHSILQSLIL